MVLERDILPYLQWLLGNADTVGALRQFVFVMLGIGLLALVGGYLVAAARNGFLRGGDLVFKTVSSAFLEFIQISPRRIWALSVLAIKEAWRRRVMVVLVVFFVILLFASWFLKTDSQNPGKLYISFVLTATTYLVLGIALLLSAFSLPGDFKAKTIYTVVTKPVRAGEIILGRIIGFTIIGTGMLLVMAICSYVFVDRSLDHTHRVEETSLKKTPAIEGKFGYQGRTSLDAYHRHDVDLNSDHMGEAASNHSHMHFVDPDGDAHLVSGAEETMRARVPLWGTLRFLDRQGVEQERGINVGNEWGYRGYIAGNTQSAAIWTFKNINDSIDRSASGLPVGLTVSVFRTHKGIIGKPITGGLQVRNPETGLQSQLDIFEALDGKVYEFVIPRKLISTNVQEIDLFDDLISSNGTLELSIHCLEGGQYLGFAQADGFLSMPDTSPAWNFVKVYLSIWVQMVIVTAIGVAISALVSGPVAMLFTVSFILLGFFKETFVEIAEGAEYGGGPLESLYRLVTQMNMTVDLSEGTTATIIQGIDNVLETFMWSVAQVLPDFAAFSTVAFAASGFDVPVDKVLQDLTTCLAYIAGLTVIGYFLLRTREVAR